MTTWITRHESPCESPYLPLKLKSQEIIKFDSQLGMVASSHFEGSLEGGAANGNPETVDIVMTLERLDPAATQ